MRKIRITSISFLGVAGLLSTAALAQQTSTSSPQQAPATKTAPAKPQASGTAKTAQKPGAKPAAPLMLQTQKDKASYALGMNLGKQIKQGGVELDPAIIARGIKDATAGRKLLLTDQEAQTALTELGNEARKKIEEARKVTGEANKKEGEAFLAANKTKEGVVALPSGLQYKIVKEGTGPKPTATDTVVCQYRGTLLNGKEFDSSYKHGQAATFVLGQIIKGWGEALQLMPVGSKWELYLPPDLAYGERGAGPDIGPNATLIFEVELVSIQPKVAAPAAAQPQAPQMQTPPPSSQPEAKQSAPAKP